MMTIIISLMALALAGTSWSAQNPTDSRWQPWLGCWDLEVEKINLQEEEVVVGALVCLAPNEEGPGITLTTVANGEAVLEETFIADGERNPVEEPGCQGWRSAEWSRDGHRLFLHSEIQCEDKGHRSVSGVSLMITPVTWVNIQMIRAGGQREIVVRRYVPADADRIEEAGLDETAETSLMARLDASRPLKMSDVVEAIHKIAPEAVEAAIVETEASFDIDSNALIGLAASRVPPDIIDLMVAISFPDRFHIDRRGRVGEQRGNAGGGMGADSFWTDSNPYYYYNFMNPFYINAPFGYHSFYSPYGYGRHYVLTTSIGVADSGGKAVKGQGYTRIQRTTTSSGEGGGQTGGYSSGSVSSGGYNSGGGGTGRTAKPRK